MSMQCGTYAGAGHDSCPDEPHIFFPWADCIFSPRTLQYRICKKRIFWVEKHLLRCSSSSISIRPAKGLHDRMGEWECKSKFLPHTFEAKALQNTKQLTSFFFSCFAKEVFGVWGAPITWVEAPIIIAWQWGGSRADASVFSAFS